MLSEQDAVSLVLASELFDDAFYAGVVGVRFASRADAAAHWVAHQPSDAAPGPTFEPAWLYPGGRWRRDAPDPLSYWLAHPEPRATHPALTPRTATVPVLVRVDGADLRLVVRWARHLERHAPDVGVEVTGALSGPARRMLAMLPGVADPDVVVEVDAGQAPPPWTWLDALLAALDRPGTDAAQPLMVDEHVVVTGPVGAGLPTSAVERLDGVVLPQRIPGALARRVGTAGPAVLATGSWLVGTAPALLSLPSAAVVEGRPSLRWSIDVAAPAAPLGRRWGDWHFARSLADALERLGQRVVIDHPETRARASRAEADVVLVLRGLERVPPAPGAVNLLWVISHPADVGPDELAGFDVAFAAGTAWAAAHDVRELLQCTDATRFHPGVQGVTGVAGADDETVLFVGNARGGMRPVVAAALAAHVPVTVIGAHWERHGVHVEAERIANAELPARYATAGVVLGDHHDDMRTAGFVSNRVFDVLAVGGRLLTDDVAGLTDLFGDLPTWRTPADVARLAVAPFASWPDRPARLALAVRVVAEHSFDARAATLLDAAVARLRLESGA